MILIHFDSEKLRHFGMRQQGEERLSASRISMMLIKKLNVYGERTNVSRKVMIVTSRNSRRIPFY